MRRRPRHDARRAGATGSPASTRPLEQRLAASLDRGWANKASQAGPWLVCEPGCSDCCHGPFAITRLDAHWLAEGLSALRRSDPERAAGIEERARRTAAALEGDFPGDPATGRLAADIEALDPFFARHRRLPCPVLDPRNGRCELYAWRPVACRTYGPPLRFGAEKADPCGLCFSGASAETVERCRWEPDPAGLEQTILARLGVSGGEEWETLIPHALVLV